MTNTTKMGLTIAHDCEDFAKWNWEYDVDSVSVAAARVVLRELIDGASIEFDVSDSKAECSFWTFDGQLTLTLSVADAVRYWVETRSGSDGLIPKGDLDEEETSVLIEALEQAAADLRKALGS